MVKTECDKFEKNVVVVTDLFVSELGWAVRNDGGI